MMLLVDQRNGRAANRVFHPDIAAKQIDFGLVLVPRV